MPHTAATLHKVATSVSRLGVTQRQSAMTSITTIAIGRTTRAA
jgi:hypothetical protein